MGKLGTDTEHPSKDLTIISCTWLQILANECPIRVILSFSVFNDIFEPPANWVFEDTLFLFMAKFVRCTNVFLIEFGSNVYFYVLNLAKPYL